MSAMNRAMVMGFLGRDVEVKFTPQGKAVANFSVATTERWKDANGQQQERTEWHEVQVWGKQAEACGSHIGKGWLVLVEGRLTTEKWKDKTHADVNHYRTRIVADRVDFLRPPRTNAQDPGRPVRGGDAIVEADIAF